MAVEGFGTTEPLWPELRFEILLAPGGEGAPVGPGAQPADRLTPTRFPTGARLAARLAARWPPVFRSGGTTVTPPGRKAANRWATAGRPLG
ncbi:hypothetical protein GCM10010430_67510 [Kitasatospora cystarginea]|uniref:Uncharacterized protein n=1 Tax=Kitasatospora cystarginea TaxID=58350 RepID=A0ABN3EVS2_9ACTN